MREKRGRKRVRGERCELKKSEEPSGRKRDQLGEEKLVYRGEIRGWRSEHGTRK